MRPPSNSEVGSAVCAGGDQGSEARSAADGQTPPSSPGASQGRAVLESVAPPESNPPSLERVSERVARLCAAVRLLVPFTERIEPETNEAKWETTAENTHE